MTAFGRHRPSRFGILPLDTADHSQIRRFEAPPCYIFHTLNAYEQGNEVILVACRMNYTSVGIVDKSQGLDGDIPHLFRWKFNLNTGTAHEERLDDIPAEFPRVNETLVGRKNQFGYLGKMSPGTVPLFDGVIKYDIQNGQSQTHKYGVGRYGGEVVFAPRPHGIAEDDGWLMTFVYDESTETSELLVLDAQQVTDEPIARVLIPQRVPYGFHGTWISNAQTSG